MPIGYLICWIASTMLIAIFLWRPFKTESLTTFLATSLFLGTAFPITLPIIIVVKIKENKNKKQKKLDTQSQESN